MKPLRNILILLLVIAVLGGGFYWVIQYEPKQEETPTSDIQTVNMFHVEKSDIASLEVESATETYTVSRSGESWIINDNPEIKANQSKIETLLYESASVTARELLEENATNLIQYGLDLPSRSVTVTLKDGKTHKILIGNTTLDGSLCYLMMEGETKVYTKSATGCDSLASSLSRLLETDIYSMNAEDVSKISIKKAGAEEILLVREQVSVNEASEPLYEWQMKNPLVKTGNAYNVEELLMENIVTQSALLVIPAGEQKGDYGLSKPQAEYSIENQDGSKRYHITVGQPQEDGTYIRLSGDSAIYQVSSSTLDFLEPGYRDLVDKLIHIENIQDVKTILVKGGGKSFLLDISGSKFKINDKEIEEKKFRKTYQAVIGLTMDDYTNEPVAGETAYSITYNKKDGTQVVVSCKSFDDRNYLVQVNGEGNLLIRKKQIDNMIAALEQALA